jgi:hypothetical protein
VVLTQTGLLISFDKYQVAPGSEGIVKILVPFKDLSEFLLPQMKERYFLTTSFVKYFRRSTVISAATGISVLVKYKCNIIF